MEKTFSQKINHIISLKDANALIKAGNKGVPRAAVATKDELRELLNQKGCIGVKIYLNKASAEPTPVIVGVNANGEELALKILGYLPTSSQGLIS